MLVSRSLAVAGVWPDRMLRSVMRTAWRGRGPLWSFHCPGDGEKGTLWVNLIPESDAEATWLAAAWEKSVAERGPISPSALLNRQSRSQCGIGYHPGWPDPIVNLKALFAGDPCAVPPDREAECIRYLLHRIPLDLKRKIQRAKPATSHQVAAISAAYMLERKALIDQATARLAELS